MSGPEYSRVHGGADREEVRYQSEKDRQTDRGTARKVLSSRTPGLLLFLLLPSALPIDKKIRVSIERNESLVQILPLFFGTEVLESIALTCEELSRALPWHVAFLLQHHHRRYTAWEEKEAGVHTPQQPLVDEVVL